MKTNKQLTIEKSMPASHLLSETVEDLMNVIPADFDEAILNMISHYIINEFYQQTPDWITDFYDIKRNGREIKIYPVDSRFYEDFYIHIDIDTESMINDVIYYAKCINELFETDVFGEPRIKQFEVV